MPDLLVGGVLVGGAGCEHVTETAHLEALGRALDAEEAWQRREHRALLERPLQERVATAVTWAPLDIDTAEVTGLGRTFLRLRTPRATVLHDGISAGDPIRVGSLAAPDEGPEGYVLSLDERVAEILVREPFDPSGPVAVTLRFDPSTFVRYREALQRAAARRTPLRDVLLGLRTPGEAPDPLPDSEHFDGLEASQRHAARLALGAAEVALVQGPPGTGKTTLLVALLRALVERGDRPWGLADSNAAVDHLAVRAAAAGLDVVRLGHPARIGSDAEPLSLDRRVAAGPLGAVLRDLDRDLVRLAATREPNAAARRRALRTEREAVETQARRAILDSADVVASTLGTLAHMAPKLHAPITAVVDEATQAIEPAVWTAVPYIEQLVLVGDPCQLGPVVLEPGNPLARSLLDRLTDTTEPLAGRIPMPMLEVQHRMHEAIQELVQPVYAHRLKAHPGVATHLLRDLPGVADTQLTGRPILFVDTAGAGFEEERDPVTHSLYNRGEIEVVANAVRLLRSAGVKPEHIGVIAPYSAQVARLAEHRDLAGVEVHTVNAFQGREKEAILCSFVRSNPEGDLGFVADGRRLTVALSRARRLCLCTGDSATLAGQPRFAALLDQCQQARALQSVWEPPWTPP